MALVDLKSDLSKFRMPKKDPLVDKKRDIVKTKQNLTPLNAFLKSRPSVNKSVKTPDKEGTSTNKFSNNSKFLGETSPNKFTFNPNHEESAKTPQRVDFITDTHAKGFTFNFNNIDNTKFIGIDPSNTIFDSTNSKFSNFSNSSRGIGFSPGYEGFKPIGSFTGDTQRYNFEQKYTADMFSKTLSKPNNGILHLQASESPIPFISQYAIKRLFPSSFNELGIQAGYTSFKLTDKLQGGFYNSLNDSQQYTTLESRFTETPILKFTDRSLLSLKTDNSFFDKMYDKFNLRQTTIGFY